MAEEEADILLAVLELSCGVDGDAIGQWQRWSRRCVAATGYHSDTHALVLTEAQQINPMTSTTLGRNENFFYPTFVYLTNALFSKFLHPAAVFAVVVVVVVVVVAAGAAADVAAIVSLSYHVHAERKKSIFLGAEEKIDLFLFALLHTMALLLNVECNPERNLGAGADADADADADAAADADAGGADIVIADFLAEIIAVAAVVVGNSDKFAAICFSVKVLL
uniref:Uncharacterized protein n=1 Tax=Glossina austeni TaxID=7395 RepID=A0A1A9V676_GLOAU